MISKTWMSVRAFKRPASTDARGTGSGGGGDCGGGTADEQCGVEATYICLNTSTASDIIARISLRIPNPSLLQLAPIGRMALLVAYRDMPLGVFDVQSWDTVCA
jgi:hypothetical protein